MKTTFTVIFGVYFISGICSAEIARNGIDIDFVTIGNAGNLADDTGYGAVSYTYRIARYEITNSQWAAFVSEAGAPCGSPIYAYVTGAYWTGGSVPANNVSWYEAAQFCNYLTSGDKSKGAYLFSGTNANPGTFLGVDRASSILTYGTSYVIPNGDEWYKAAYYTGNGYSVYANGTDTMPVAGRDTNCYDEVGKPWDVGSGSQEQNGTFDMMGNIYEWTETLIDSKRGTRGGSWDSFGSVIRSTDPYFSLSPTEESPYFGFRIVSVPEPCSLIGFGLGLAFLIRRKNSLAS